MDVVIFDGEKHFTVGYFNKFHLCGLSIGVKRRFPEKSSCSFGFCPDEGGGPCPNFLSTFHKLYILGQFGDGEGETPAQIFWHIGVKKSGTSCSNEGGKSKMTT